MTGPDTTQRGPERFASAGDEHTETTAIKALGAGLALMLLVIGIPVALWLLTGPPPYPHGVPSRDALTQPVTTETVLAVLRAVVWLAWLQFTVCTVIEAVSLLRGRGLPRPVPLSGRSQQLARALVGTLLVGGVLAGSAGTSVAATVSASPRVAGHATTSLATPSVKADIAQERSTPRVDADQRDDRRAVHAGVPSDMTDVIGKKVYVVQPPDGSYHDNLWDIAERHLDNGRRWQEIFDLNKGRVQPDGGELVLGRLIQPGWVLIMPEDAKGLDRVEAAPATPDSTPPVRVLPDAGDVGGDVADTAGDVEHDEAARESKLARDLTGGGIVAAGLLAALAAERRRRRGGTPDDEALEAEVGLLVGVEPLGAACRHSPGPSRCRCRRCSRSSSTTSTSTSVWLRHVPTRRSRGPRSTTAAPGASRATPNRPPSSATRRTPASSASAAPSKVPTCWSTSRQSAAPSP